MSAQGNLPPGVGDNHPIFDDGPEYDTDELDTLIGDVEDSMGTVEEAMTILVNEGYFTQDEQKELILKIESVKDELDYFTTQQKADW